MRFARCAIALFLCLVASAAFAGTVMRNGTALSLDGDPFSFVGANCYYLMEKARNGEYAAVDQVLDEAQGLGLRVVRTWAFYDGAGGLQPSPAVYDDSYLDGLDYVLKGARDRDLKLILPFTNYWADYGGMPQNVAWDLGISLGAAGNDRNEFYYQSSDSWDRYRDSVVHVLERENTLLGGLKYKDDDTVMAWELANEPRASTWAGYGTAAQDRAAYLDWIGQMSAYIKGLDPDTLVTLGTEGMDPRYGSFGNEQTQFIADQAFANIDVAVGHSWPETWSFYYDLETQAEFMAMVAAQADDSLNVLGKPYVLEEFGYPRDSDGGTTLRDDWLNAYFQTAFYGGTSGAMFWTLYDEDYLDYDGYGIYPTDDSTRDLVRYWAQEFAEHPIDDRAVVPEPATWLLTGMALATVLWRRRRCRAA